MLGKTILLYTDDRGASRTLTGHLRGAGNEVVTADGAAAARDLIGAHAVDLVLVDAGAEGARDVLYAARDHAPAVALSARGEPSVMLDLVCELEVEHILQGDGSLDELAREVVVTAEKILRADLFGLEKYLPGFGVELSAAEVRGAADRDTLVECIGDHVEWLGAGRDARRAVADVVDELVTNAVYDAPRDAAGRARYASTDRRTKIVLDAWEHVAVRWGSDGDSIAISVTDRFGALRPEHVRNGLRRCLTAADPIEQKAGGAGIGLYTTLSSCSQLIVNVDRGVRTEIIAIVDLRRRGAARRSGRSLHLFFDDSRAREAVPCDATPTTVAISDSMLVELRETLAPSKRRAEVVPLLHAKRAPTVRARGTDAPPNEPIGAGTACGLLRGAATPETAIAIGLRFLAHHFEAAVAFAAHSGRLDAASSAGRVRDWARLRQLHLGRGESAGLTAAAARGLSTWFQPSSPMDHLLAMHAAGNADAAGVVLPLAVGGELRWVLYGVGARDVGVAASALEQVRREVEACLGRLDPDEPMIEVGSGRL